MKYLHWEVQVPEGWVVRVDLSGNQAWVLLMDATNFWSFRSNRPHRRYGGHWKTTPAILTPPHPGAWNVVVHLGGHRGGVDANVSVVAPDAVG